MTSLKQHTAKLLGALLCAASISNAALAMPVVFGFDGFSDGTSMSNQYAGLQFSYATVLHTGASLNDSAFPPHSLHGVVLDDGGPIAIRFSAPVFSVGGYFTYLSGMTFSAYDSNDQLLATLVGAYASNAADGSGDTASRANEFLQIRNAAGLISRVTLTSDRNGGSFVLDDLTVDTGAAVAEPSPIALMAGALCAGLLLRRWRRS